MSATVEAVPVPSGYNALSLAGRCANGWERGKGVRFHAVPDGTCYAACGATYGRRSAGWSWDKGAAITCPKCIRRLRALAGGAPPATQTTDTTEE